MGLKVGLLNSVSIEDINNMPEMIAQLEAMQNTSVEIYIEGDQMNIIAASHEFGAIISKDPLKAKKAKQFVAMKMKQRGLEIKPNGKAFIEIPERSFMRSAFDDPEVLDKIAETFRFYLYRFLTGKSTAKECFTRAGEVLVNAIQSRIGSNMTPAKHPLSVLESGSSKTLQSTEMKLIKSIRIRLT